MGKNWQVGELTNDRGTTTAPLGGENDLPDALRRMAAGLRRRREDEAKAWAGFRTVAVVLLNDPVGSQRTGEPLVAVATDRRPLNGGETRERGLA